LGELNEERLSVYLEEVLIKWSRDIPRPLFINKLNQEVMWRTESKLALVAIALVLGGIYGMSNKGNNRRQMPSFVLMENGS
jgi:hypothetical protein